MGKSKTTIRLNDKLKKQAKKRAVELNSSFQKLVEDALTAYLGKSNSNGDFPGNLITKKLGKFKNELKRENIYKDDEEIN